MNSTTITKPQDVTFQPKLPIGTQNLKPFKVLLAIGCTVLVVASAGRAATCTWIGNPMNPHWFEASNWSPPVVPGVGDIAIVTQGTIVATSAVQVLDLTFSGESFSGNITFDRSMNWTCGYMMWGTLTVPSNGVLTISGNDPKGLRNSSPWTPMLAAALHNKGTVVWEGGGTFGVADMAEINNEAGALFDVRNDAQLEPHFSSFGAEYPGPALKNAGILRKSAGSGTSTISIPLINTGGVDVETGKLLINYQGAGTSSGYIKAATNTEINFELPVPGRFSQNTLTLLTGSSFAGLGTNRFSSGSYILSGTVLTENLEMTGGTLTGTGSISGTITWIGGQMSGNGVLTLTSNTVFTIREGGHKELGYMDGAFTIYNEGTIIWEGGESIMPHAAVIINQADGLLDVRNDGSMWSEDLAFHNAGVLRKSGGGAVTRLAVQPFNNIGTVEAKVGTLAIGISGMATNSGRFTAEANAQIEFAEGMPGGAFMPGGASLTLLGGSAFTGMGVTRFNKSDGTLVLNGSIFSENFEMTSGSLTGTGSISGAMRWTGGSMSRGDLLVARDAMLTIQTTGPFGGCSLSEFTLNNSGTILWKGGNIMGGFMGGGEAINNHFGGLFDVSCDGSISQGSLVFNNSGIFRKSAGTGDTSVNCSAFTNAGTFSIQSGRMVFPSMLYCVQTAGATLLDGGCLSGSLDIQSGVLGGSGTIEGSVINSGRVRPGRPFGTLTISGIFEQTPGGELDIELGGPAPGTQYDRLAVSSAILAGRMNVSLANRFVPASADTFEILTFSTLTGGFSSYGGLDLIGTGRRLRPHYGPDSLTLGTGDFLVEVPVIISQPESITTNSHASVSIAVTANGTAPFEYQWQQNGTNIVDATNQILTLDAIDTNHVADYSVIVANNFGSVTSDVARLTIELPIPDLQLLGLRIDDSPTSGLMIDGNGDGAWDAGEGAAISFILKNTGNCDLENIQLSPRVTVGLSNVAEPFFLKLSIDSLAPGESRVCELFKGIATQDGDVNFELSATSLGLNRIYTSRATLATSPPMEPMTVSYRARTLKSREHVRMLILPLAGVKNATLSFTVQRPGGTPSFVMYSSLPWLKILSQSNNRNSSSFFCSLDTAKYQSAYPYSKPGDIQTTTITVYNTSPKVESFKFYIDSYHDLPYISIEAVQMNQAVQDSATDFDNLVAARSGVFMVNMRRTDVDHMQSTLLDARVRPVVRLLLKHGERIIYDKPQVSVPIDGRSHLLQSDDWVKFPISPNALSIPSGDSMLVTYTLSVYKPGSPSESWLDPLRNSLKSGSMSFRRKRQPKILQINLPDAPDRMDGSVLLEDIAAFYPIPNAQVLAPSRRMWGRYTLDDTSDNAFIRMAERLRAVAKNSLGSAEYSSYDAFLVLTKGLPDDKPGKTVSINDAPAWYWMQPKVDKRFVFVNEISTAPATIAHEFGHVCGLKEEYGLLKHEQKTDAFGRPVNLELSVPVSSSLQGPNNAHGFQPVSKLKDTEPKINQACADSKAFWTPDISYKTRPSVFSATTFKIDLNLGDHIGGYVGSYCMDKNMKHFADEVVALHNVGPYFNPDGKLTEDLVVKKAVSFMGTLYNNNPTDTIDLYSLQFISIAGASPSVYAFLYNAGQLQPQSGDERMPFQTRAASGAGVEMLYMSFWSPVTNLILAQDFVCNVVGNITEPDYGNVGEYIYAVRTLDASGMPLTTLDAYGLPDTDEGNILINWWIPWPEGARRAVVLHEGLVVVEATQSSAVPLIDIVAPQSQEELGLTNVIRWHCSQQGQDHIRFDIDYAPDGETFVPIAQGLGPGTSNYVWTTRGLPGGTNGALRVRAWGSMRSAEAVVAGLILDKKPPHIGIIVPGSNAVLCANGPVTLMGYASDLEDATLGGTSVWWTASVDGFLGFGRTLEVTNLVTPARQDICFVAQDSDANTVTSTVPVLVSSDFDQDGLPDIWEAQYSVTATNIDDAYDDPDGDGLRNLTEWRMGTHPGAFDTDGDGHSDGSEVEEKTSPTDANSVFGPSSFRIVAPSSGVHLTPAQAFTWTPSTAQVGSNSVYYVITLATNDYFLPILHHQTVSNNWWSGLSDVHLPYNVTVWWMVEAVDEYGARTLASTTGPYYFETSVDSDGDGIADVVEAEYGMRADSADSDGDGISDVVEAGLNLSAPVDTDKDGIVDALDSDSDNDGMSDRDEWIAGTSPTDSNSFFSISAALITGTNTLILRWSSVAARTYSIYRSTDLWGGYLPVQTNILASPPENSFVDSATNGTSLFYRVEVTKE